MKRGTVYYRDILAGELVKDDEGYLFRYDPMYFVYPSMPDVSATLQRRSANIVPRCCSRSSSDCSRSRHSRTRQRCATSFASTTG